MLKFRFYGNVISLCPKTLTVHYFQISFLLYMCLNKVLQILTTSNKILLNTSLGHRMQTDTYFVKHFNSGTDSPKATKSPEIS